jgi:hypothetical protein
MAYRASNASKRCLVGEFCFLCSQVIALWTALKSTIHDLIQPVVWSRTAGADGKPGGTTLPSAEHSPVSGSSVVHHDDGPSSARETQRAVLPAPRGARRFSSLLFGAAPGVAVSSEEAGIADGPLQWLG